MALLHLWEVIMAFTVNDLLLSPDRAGQLTKALANLGVADPLQYLCDEAAADVARLTLGYVIDEASLRSFVRSLALFRAYSKAGPVPKTVEKDYEDALKELGEIAAGKRPNLPKVDAAAGSPGPGAGAWGGAGKITGRISGQV